MQHAFVVLLNGLTTNMPMFSLIFGHAIVDPYKGIDDIMSNISHN